MKLDKLELDKLLKIDNRQDLKKASLDSGFHVDGSQAQRITDCLMRLNDESAPYRLGIVHTYTSELLNPWLKLCFTLQGLNCEIYHAPFGVTMLEAQPESGLVQFSPDMTLLMLQRSDLHPSLWNSADNLDDGELKRTTEAAISYVENLVGHFRRVVKGQILVTVLPELFSPELGWFDIQSKRSEVFGWECFKHSLANVLQGRLSGVSFLDLDELIRRCGRTEFFDLRFWYSSRFPFSASGATLFSEAISTFAVTQQSVKAKVIVLDADNTLWGGIVGEDGLQGIDLGPDYPGNIFLDFQRRILGYRQRGFLLALCSKNNPDDVEQVFDQHPHQVLKNEHFVAQRVNWLPKSENIRSIAQELNLGLDSFIFVDDSAHECAEVKLNLNQVEVVKVPSRVVEIPTCLDKLARLEVLYITAEDNLKTKMYAQERERLNLKESFASGASGVEQYLRSLNMKMSVGLNDLTRVKRLAQLTQKTNQYNLTTRRYQENELEKLIMDKLCLVFHFSLSDNFGDSGVVGLAIVHLLENRRARLGTFLMSCRVIGRKAETAFLQSIVDILKAEKIEKLYAEYIPTAKNSPVKDFLKNSGFAIDDDGELSISTISQGFLGNMNVPISIAKEF